MQFAGKPIEISPNRVYNCAFLPVNAWQAFPEIMFMLLGGCFHENTEIKTKEGNKKIKDITIEDYILTFDTEKKKYFWINPFAILPTPTEEKKKFLMEFDDGSSIKCTEDHKFFTKNRGWVKAKNLQDTDDIEFFNDDLDIETINLTEAEIKQEYPLFF
jgi:hypothetical protein